MATEGASSHHHQTPPEVHLGPVVDERTSRDRFETAELAMVLSHFDLGRINVIRDYPRGSRRSPKLYIRCERGRFLLKRRAPGRDDPFRVAFAHTLLLFLKEHDYPVPRLYGTRSDNNSLLQLNGHTYELFEFIDGDRTDGSLPQAGETGRALGELHRLLLHVESDFQPGIASFHNADLGTTFAQLGPAVERAEPETDSDALRRRVNWLREAYAEACRRVDGFRVCEWDRIITHGDWHPGNLLFREGSVAGVLDFDASRREPPAVEIANAALQFSMQIGEPERPESWPEGLSVSRMKAIIMGYEAGAGRGIDSVEKQALPWLMIEALIVESIIPIAATGAFSRIKGTSFLEMIERKVRWLGPRANTLAEALEK